MITPRFNKLLKILAIICSFVFLPPLFMTSALSSPLKEKQPLHQESIVIAVIDTGADLNHPDLKKWLWQNPGESGLDEMGRSKSKNGIDDDGNGFIDDFNGWNFVSENNDLRDFAGHGTHIAGIISQIINQIPAEERLNTRPVRIMILKYFDPRFPQVNSISTTAKAILYATRMGAKVINYSAGGFRPNQKEYEALEEAKRNDVIVVAAAGNESSNNDSKGFFPASYPLSNIVAVMAHDADYKPLHSTNYGARSVALAAPGEKILSSIPGGGRGTMTGTSQSTAFVSAACAIFTARYRDINDPMKVIESLLSTGIRSKSLSGKSRSGTALHIERNLAIRGHGLSVTDTVAENTSAHLPTDYVAAFDQEMPLPPPLP